jgi:hypothetical protein
VGALRVSEWSASSAWTWVICFLGVDFFYYWFHRASHESEPAWGAPHSSTTPPRSSTVGGAAPGRPAAAVQLPFYLPLAWLGFPAARLPRLLELRHPLSILDPHPRDLTSRSARNGSSTRRPITGSHHGCDEKYIDKNYAGTLIIWDRMFGSFQPRKRSRSTASPSRSRAGIRCGPTSTITSTWPRASRARRAPARLSLVVEGPGLAARVGEEAALRQAVRVARAPTGRPASTTRARPPAWCVSAPASSP